MSDPCEKGKTEIYRNERWVRLVRDGRSDGMGTQIKGGWEIGQGEEIRKQLSEKQSRTGSLNACALSHMRLTSSTMRSKVYAFSEIF